MLTQKQLTTKKKFKAHFDAMLTDKVSGEFIFEHKGYNYVLANADEINKISQNKIERIFPNIYL